MKIDSQGVRMKKIGFLILLVLLLSGCDALLDRGLKQYDVVIEPAEVTIAQGSSEKVTVDIKLLTGVEVSVATAKLKYFDGPEGVPMDPESFELGTGARANPVTIMVAEDAPLIEEALFEIEAVRDGLTQYGELKVTIVAPETAE